MNEATLEKAPVRPRCWSGGADPAGHGGAGKILPLFKSSTTGKSALRDKLSTPRCGGRGIALKSGQMPEEHLPIREFDDKDLIVRLDLQFAADIRMLGPVVEQVTKLVEEMECAREKHFEIELALHEALVNAIVHGCGKDPSKHIQLTVCCDTSRGVLMVVRDPGSGFDVSQIPSPVFGENVFASSGRGIFLISQLMDEVQFRKGGTEIRMIKR